MSNPSRSAGVGLIIFGVIVSVSSTVLGQAVITSINPNQGPIAGGTTVTLSGSGFSGTTLTFGGAAITPQSASDTQIVFVTPAHDSGIVNAELSGNGPNAYTQFLYVPPALSSLPPGYITTVMGVGLYRGDGGQATKAMINSPVGGVVVASDGSFFIDEPNYNTIRHIRTDGIIERYAGTGQNCCTLGDGGAALNAVLGHPRGLALDMNGNLLLADSLLTNAIRKIDATGIISTIVGSSTAGFSGDGGPASSALLNDPVKIAFDGHGNLYILDFGNSRIRKVDASGTISTIAGTGVAGYTGDGGSATLAEIQVGVADDGGLAADANGNVYLADQQDQVVRRVDGSTGIITTFMSGAGFANAVTTDSSGNVYVGTMYFDSTSPHIFKLSPTGTVLQRWGQGAGYSPDGTSAATAQLGAIGDIALDASGNVVFSDGTSGRVRRINLSTGLLETIGGISPHIIGETGPAIATVVGQGGTGLVEVTSGNLLTAESSLNIMRQMDAAGNLTDFAGNGLGGLPIQNEVQALGTVVSAKAASLSQTTADLFIDDAGIRRIDTSGVIHQVTSTGFGFSGDGGPAIDATLEQPWDVNVDAGGNVFIADTNNNRIREIYAATGIINTVAGSGPSNGAENYGAGTTCGDGGPATSACINTPYGIAVAPDGTMYIGENNQRIRRADPIGIITTFSSLGGSTLRLNAAGNLFMTPYRFEPNGHVFQFAGTAPTSSGLGDGGPASAANFNPGAQGGGFAIDAAGDIFFYDAANLRIRAIRYGAVITEPGSTVSVSGGTPQSAPEEGAFAAALEVTVNSPAGTLENGIRVDFAAPTTGASCTFPNGQSTYSALTGLNGIASATCVANNQTGSYSVTATPLALGSSVTFALTNLAAPVVNLSPAALMFASHTIGTTSGEQSTTVTNGGSANLTFSVGAVTISGSNAADFSLSSDGCSGQTIASSGTCSVSITYKPSIAGSETAMLKFTDNAANSPQTVTLSGTGADFSVAVATGASSSAAVSPGGTASYSLAFAPEGGFTGTVNVSCTGAPSLATCTVSPASVALSGTAAQSVTVSVSTTAPGEAEAGQKEPWLPPPVEWMVIATLSILALELLAQRDRRWARTARARTALAAVVLLAAVAAGCGGGGGSSSPPPSPGTPAGTYTLTVTGTSGTLTHSTKLTLTVN